MDKCFYYHTSILVEDDVYIWGGYRPGLPMAHDSPEQRQSFSSVKVFNMLNASIVKKPTTGTPPKGAMDFGSCRVGNDIYYFGGWCGKDCYHNDLIVLNTTSNKWSQIVCNNGPMEKSGCGMIPFSINDEHYILVIGGFGPLPSNPPSRAQYTRNPLDPSKFYTNNVHIMCVSTTPGEWTIPRRSGSVFPPSYGFSINTLPGNRAIIFGGECLDEHNKKYYSNDVYIVSYTNNTVDFQTLDHSATNVPRPKGRYLHSSVVISSVSDNEEEKHYLLVLGGRHTSDCWLMEITNNYQWKQILLPEVVMKRRNHSMSCYNMSDHCKWLIVSGGTPGGKAYISCPNRLMIVELVFSPTDDNWTVTNVLNEEDMKNTDKYAILVLDRLSERRNRRGRGKEQIQKQQLKKTEQDIVLELSLVQRRLEDERRAHDITRQQMEGKNRELCEKDNAVQQKNEALQLKDVQLQEKDEMLQRNRKEIQRKDASIQQQQTRIGEDIKKFELLQSEKDSLSQQKKDMAHEIGQLRKEKEALQQEMKGKINEITTLDQKYVRLKQDKTALQTNSDGKERELSALKTRVDDETKRYKLLQIEKDAISQEIKDMAHRLKVDDLCDVMLSIAYIQHQWEELGRVLRVPSSELQRIASKDCTVTRSLYNTLRYWIVRIGGSWKGLVDALKHKDIEQQKLADTIDHDHAKTRKRQTILLKDHKLIAQYNDLLPYDIFSHVDWMVLGAVLGLDDDTLEQIESGHGTDDTRAQVMVDRWISTGQAYWSLLVDALDSPIFGETELANQIAKDEMDIDIQTGGTDDGTFTEGTYEINEAIVKGLKDDISQKLTYAASTLDHDKQPKGIIYAFVMTGVKGARVDLTTITNTFEKDLKFAVYPVEDITGAKLANLIKAAATVDYPLSCKHICFYFAGHGGIKDKRPFFKPVADKDSGELFFIRENVLIHFGKKTRPKDKFIFFFDCCLSQSPDDKTPAEIGFSLEAPVRCLIAYATTVGVKSYGDMEIGGRWTSTLCEHLKEQVELGEALAKTHDVVMKLSDNKQPSHYRSCIGPVYLKGKQQKQLITKDEEESKNILRRHRSDLYEALHNNPTDLTRLATLLSVDGIIDHTLEDEVIRCRGKKEEVVVKFLDKLELKADKQPTCLPRLFEKMTHFDGSLSVIAQILMKEASNDKDLAITTDLYEDLNKCKADLDKCKAENEALKEKLETLDKERKKQITNLRNAHSKMATVIENMDNQGKLSIDH